MVCRILDRNSERFGEPEGVVVAPTERVTESRRQFKRMVRSANGSLQRLFVAKGHGIKSTDHAVVSKLEFHVFEGFRLDPSTSNAFWFADRARFPANFPFHYSSSRRRRSGFDRTRFLW